MKKNYEKMNNQIPLILSGLKPEKMMTDELPIEKVIYDYKKQIPVFYCGGETRQIGTRSLQSHRTQKKRSAGDTYSTMDHKNSIDDSKSIK